MLNAEDFRKIACDALRNKWGLAIGTGFVARLLGGAIAGGGTNVDSRFKANFNFNNKFDASDLSRLLEHDFIGNLQPWVSGLVTFAIIFTIFSAILALVIGGAASLGYAKFNLNLVDKTEAEFPDLFSQFDRLWAGFCMRFLQSLYVLLWSLLLIIPGIIASYSYAMTPYIMAENPSLGANDAISYSKELMDGNKWRLFCLEFSFVGWNLLCIFTLGIGFLWLMPYREAATAAFYRNISGNADNRKAPYIEGDFEGLPLN